MTTTFIDEPYVAGGTYNHELTAEKDGVVWDLTGATVTFYLKDPDGNVSSFSATVTDGTAGVAGYINAVGDIDEAGAWHKRFKVSKSGIVQFSTWEQFLVEEGE